MRGGKREGSGRKKSETTTTIGFRIKVSLKKELQEKYPNHLNELFVKFLNYLENGEH